MRRITNVQHKCKNKRWHTFVRLRQLTAGQRQERIDLPAVKSTTIREMAFSKIFTKLMIAKSGSRGVQTRLLLKRFDNQQRFYAVICCTHIKRSPVLDQQRKKWGKFYEKCAQNEKNCFADFRKLKYSRLFHYPTYQNVLRLIL